jgi:hypothetical protein
LEESWHTDIITNIILIEERLDQISEDLYSLYNQARFGKSPGLGQAIKLLEEKKYNFGNCLDLWKLMHKECPGYDR